MSQSNFLGPGLEFNIGVFPPPGTVTFPTTETNGYTPFESASPVALLMPTHVNPYGGSVLQSVPSSQTSSAPNRNAGDNRTGQGKPSKSDLSAVDRANFDTAGELLIIEIINRIGWEDDDDENVKECLNQACMETGIR